MHTTVLFVIRRFIPHIAPTLSVYRETQRNVTAPAQWQEFLASACRNYRLSFDEQLLVYAQRPDATAVLEIERWNKRFGRWVNRGANGIAVFDGLPITASTQ